MRWIVALVTAACLWAAGGARPDELQPRDRQPAQLTHASSGLAPHIVARRDGSRGDLRLSAFTVPAPATLGPPPRVLADGRRANLQAIDGIGPVAPRARGPPRG